MGKKLSYTIRLNNVVVYGFHGVHPEEKTLGQRFEIDLEYRLKNPADPWKDEEHSTISYVNAHSIISRICSEKSFNLIETLGNRIIEEMRESYLVEAGRAGRGLSAQVKSGGTGCAGVRKV